MLTVWIMGRRERAIIKGSLAAAALVTAAVLASCGGGGSSAAEAGRGAGRDEDAVAVRVAGIEREPISSSYSTSATLRADRTATVIARTRGVVERLAVEEGDRVEAGQAMAYLENDEQEIAAARARAAAENQQREFERLRDLYAQELVSEEEFELARREAVDARHALELTELALSRTIIRAPFPGIVVERFLDVGATVADGTEVYELADLSPLYVDINVPERHVTRLDPGQTVLLRAESAGATVDGTIERIAPAVDPATGTVKVTVAVRGDTELRPGSFVAVEIITDTHPNALVVPRSALVAEGRRWQVFRLRDDGETVDQIEVKLGFETAERVEIADVVSPETELEPGSRVVVAGAPALSDGARVRVVDGARSGDAG